MTTIGKPKIDKRPNLTDPQVEPRKSKWKIEVAIKLAED